MCWFINFIMTYFNIPPKPELRKEVKTKIIYKGFNKNPIISILDNSLCCLRNEGFLSQEDVKFLSSEINRRVKKYEEKR